MELDVHLNEVNTVEVLSRKRKRSNEDNSSEVENLDSDDEEYDLLKKYFTDNSRPETETVNGQSEENSLDKQDDYTVAQRKRKYKFKSNGGVPKKCRRFYYLNESMTKPRRPKVQPPRSDEKHKEVVLVKKCKMHFAKIDNFGNLCLMHRSHLKSDLLFNDEKKCNYEDFKKVDLSFYIVDEIALEGLDGITIEAFWKRLKNVFPNNVSKYVADRIWRIICNNKRINFYVLNEPREELIFYDPCKYLDIDSVMFVEPFKEFKDIYPLASVRGNEIRGSCSTFETRKENNGVRKFSIDKALKLYDQRLVFVADQTLRNKALISEEADPNLELVDVEYCMLEKIGRCRDQGEFTQGKMSLSNDTKKVYHNRKALTQDLLVVPQTFCLKSLAQQQNISGSLVHLTRFYRKRKTKYIAIMEKLANILRTRTNYQIEFNEFRKIFGRNVSINKLLKTADFRKFFKSLIFPYRKLYPNAPKKEYMHKSLIKERQVRVIRMIDPCANITALMDDKTAKEVFPTMPDFSVGHKLMNYEYLRDVFLYILSTDQKGATVHEINEHFKTDFYCTRMAVRKLLLRNAVSSSKVDMGRQQTLKFFAKSVALPGYHIKTEPKTYQLDEATLVRVLESYGNKTTDNSIQFYEEPEPVTELLSIQTQHKLDFEPFCCTAFLTETMDPISEELTIYDIFIKGRDKLLLIESNLAVNYINEWDDFLLKRDDFSKGIQLFQNGFGKGIYDFLMTIRISDGFEVDNRLVFNINKVTPETRICLQRPAHRIVNTAKNYNHPHSDRRHEDIVAKIYLFEAILNEDHRNNGCIDKLKFVFERMMIHDGKQKLEKSQPVKTEPKVKFEVASNVVMEKFMGVNPSLEWCDTEEGIKIEIFVSTTPSVPRHPTGSMFVPTDDSVTQRYVNRANSILKIVYDQAIVRDVKTIYKDILIEEGVEGYDKKCCKKSIISIISKLVSEGYIKCFKIVMTSNNRTKTQCFICKHEVDSQHVFIKSTIEQLKLKFYIGNAHIQQSIAVKKNTESPFSSNNVKESIAELRQLTTIKTVNNCKIDRTKAKAYGYMPKFIRMRVLHEHMYYIMRELTECEHLTNRQMFELCKNMKIVLSKNDITEMPPIYTNEVGWKMFIPPLPKQTNYSKGWALACDIILRMPLSVFVKLVNISFDIPELMKYLAHPIQRHYLIKYLPASIRNILLHRRKYFHSIYEIITNLCYIGLLQLGPRNFKEKDQLFIYINSKATLYDTSSSKPGYNLVEDKKYKKISFDFKSANDVEIYWSEMLRICMNTQLGKRKVLDGQYVTIEDCASKPAMMETLKAQTFDGAVANDIGKIPGDRRGSAGFDSSLWSFIKRNWSWNSQVENKSSSNMQAQLTGVGNDTFDVTSPEPIHQAPGAKEGSPERKICLKSAKQVKKVTTLKSIVIKRNAKKKIVRKIVAPRKKRIREYYDAIDKTIMKKNYSLRVEWDEEEDQILRYCRVALLFLCPSLKRQFIPYNVMRDVLHRLCLRSKNKTARALQRRIYVLLTNDEAIKIMESNVENLLNSDLISKYFEQIHNRYKYNIKLSDEQIYICFVYLMAYMFKHKKEIELLLLGYFATFDFLSEANISEFESIIDKCAKETVPIYTNPKNVDEITKDTITSVVHCSMSCRKNSVGWTFYLSRIYKKFKDDLIRSAVAKLKKDQLLVNNKSFGSKHNDNSWPVPIKFSYSYNVMKTTTYTSEIYREAYKSFLAMIDKNTKSDIVTFIVFNELNSFWEKVNLIFEIPELGIILNPEIEDHGEVIEELAKRFSLYLNKIYEKNTGVKDRTENAQEVPIKGAKEVEKNIEEIKSEVRHLIFRVPYLIEGNVESNFKKMLDSTNTSEIINYIYLITADLKKFAQNTITSEELRCFINNIEEESNMDDPQKLLKNLSKVVFGIQNIHPQQIDSTSFEEAFNLWEIEIWNEGRTKNVQESVKNSQKNLFNKNYGSEMENCIKRAKEGNFPSLEEIKEGMMAEVGDFDDRAIPHITDLIMLLNEDKFPELETDNETIQNMKDHFIMKYPKLNEFVIEDLEEMKNNAVVKKIMNDQKILKIKTNTEKIVIEPRIDQVVQYILSRNGNESDIRVTEDLIDFIKDKKEVGASAQELKVKFTNETGLDLVNLLWFLTEVNLILRTGVTSIVYVHHEYQSEWLTETFMLSPKEKEVFELKKKHDMKEAKKNLKHLMGEKIQSADRRKVQLKPWTKLDGSINDDVFNEWLCIILSRCMNLPNIPFLVLCEQFHYIKPVDLYFLLEVLEELGCVEINVFNSVESTVFSTRNIISECKATCLDSFNAMFVKPTNVSGLCFGSYLEMIEF